MLRHVGVCMSENGLRVFQSEFFPHNVCVRMSQLVRHPAFDNGLVACPCNGSAIGCPGDLEQLLIWTGRQIPRQDQLSQRPEVQCPVLTMMAGFVIAEFCNPDFSRAIDHPGCKFEQFAGPCPGEPLQVDQVAHQW